MTVTPTTDHGQMLSSPAGKVIGFLDSKAEYDSFAAAVQSAGFPTTSVTSLFGDEGLQLLERQKENSFFFGDSEDSVIHQSLVELSQGHYAVAVEVSDRIQALQIVNLAVQHGGHGLRYFGLWATELLTA